MPRAARTPNGKRALLFFEPPQRRSPENDINSLIFLCRDSNNNPAYVSKQIIANFILNPTKITTEFSTLKMRSVDLHDELRPAHLPSYDDCYGLPVLIKRVIKWFLEKHHTVPYYLQHLIDPEPILDFTNPTCKIEFDALLLCMGNYTDAFQVVQPPAYPCVLILTVIRAPESTKRAPYHVVGLDPVLTLPWVPNVTPIHNNTRIVTWNVRGITRDSFIRNFELVQQSINPSIIVLVETRHFTENVIQVVERLPRRYNVLISSTRLFGGGCVVLWKAEMVKVVHNPTFLGPQLCNVIVQGARSQPKNPSASIQKAKKVLRAMCFK